MALISQSSRRYAEAAVESALAHGETALEALTQEIGALAGAVSLNPDLENVLMNPVFSTAERAKVLDAVMGQITSPFLASKATTVVSA